MDSWIYGFNYKPPFWTAVAIWLFHLILALTYLVGNAGLVLPKGSHGERHSSQAVHSWTAPEITATRYSKSGRWPVEELCLPPSPCLCKGNFSLDRRWRLGLRGKKSILLNGKLNRSSCDFWGVTILHRNLLKLSNPLKLVTWYWCHWICYIVNFKKFKVGTLKVVTFVVEHSSYCQIDQIFTCGEWKRIPMHQRMCHLNIICKSQEGSKSYW